MTVMLLMDTLLYMLMTMIAMLTQKQLMRPRMLFLTLWSQDEDEHSHEDADEDVGEFNNDDGSDDEADIDGWCLMFDDDVGYGDRDGPRP